MAGNERTGKGKHRFICGTPADKCTGGIAEVSHMLSPQIKRVHGSRTEAMRCHVRYLKSVGYTQLGPHEFRLNNGPVLVISKRIRFGGDLRPGKGGRNMPTGHGQYHHTGGAFV